MCGSEPRCLVVAFSADAVRSGRNLGIGVGFGGGFGHCDSNWGSGGGREGSGGNHGIWRQQRDLAGTTTSDGGGPGLTVK